MSDDRAAVIALTEFLTKRDSYARTSPIESVVQGKIQALMRELADEVVRETPGLRDMLRERVSATISATLRDDNWLNQKVTGAVAKALIDIATGDDND